MTRLHFKRSFHAAIRAGTKRTTLRRWSRPRVAAGEIVLAPGVGELTIDRVEAVRETSFSETDAKADGFASLADLKATLRQLYPEAASDGKQWFKVSFRVGPPGRARRSGSPGKRRAIAKRQATDAEGDRQLLAAAVVAELDKVVRQRG